MTLRSNHWIRHFGCAFACAALLSNACAGKAVQSGNGQQSPAGGDGNDGAVAGGGAANLDQAGAAPTEEGGAAMSDEGGTTSVGGGGRAAAGASNSAGAGPCAKVSCPAIPTSCKHFVQGPKDCCPTCTDTGCAECAELDCDPGTHAATVPGDCCPSCLTDPPDACAVGQKLYADLRAQLLDKYGSGSCKNSTECSITREDNACAQVCNIALPAESVHNWVANLDNSAKGCLTCGAPAQIECQEQIAACVNGKCIGIDVGP